VTSSDTPVEETPGELYLYGIVRAGQELPEGLVGVVATVPRAVEHGDLAVIVSDIAEDADFGTPADLVAHSAVLDEVARATTVLPIRFGTVVPTTEDLVEQVLEDPDGLLSALSTLEGATQYTVRARYEQESLLPEILRDEPELARLQQQIAGTSEAETRNQRIALGEGIVAAFDARREPDAQQLRETLEPLARDVVEHEVGSADDVLGVAVLVAREDAERFEAAVEDAAERHHPRMRIRLLGPQAPYDFVEGSR
jgi:hypothetical protein